MTQSNVYKAIDRFPLACVRVVKYPSVCTNLNPKYDVTKYVEERRIREGCERQRHDTRVPASAYVRVLICVCVNYGFFAPSRKQGGGEAGWSSLFLPRGVAAVAKDTRRFTRVEEMLRSIRRLPRELRARSVPSRCDGRAFLSGWKKRKRKEDPLADR